MHTAGSGVPELASVVPQHVYRSFVAWRQHYSHPTILDNLSCLGGYPPWFQAFPNDKLCYLLHQKGVTGIDEQDQINRFVSPHSPRRFRHDMPAERSAIHEMLKDLKWKGKDVDMPLMEGNNSVLRFSILQDHLSAVASLANRNLSAPLFNALSYLSQYLPHL